MEYELITTVDVDSNGEEEKLASLPSTVEESSVSGENKSPEEREESHDASTNALLSESHEKEDSNQEENEQVGQQNMITENFSECLKSPIDAAVFSPSLDINDNGNLHGLALYLATERSKSISRFGRQMASSLADVASVYETFGMLILRAAPPPTSSEYEFSKECYETSRKFAMGERRVAEWYRTKIVDPMQEMLTTNRASIESSNKHYVDSRVDCYKIRKNALTAKTEYVRAVREAEALFVVWKESRKKIPLTATPEEPTAANDNAVLWEVTLRRLGKSVPEVTGRLIQQLKDVVEFQKKYTELVEKENRAVEYSQEAEASALHEFQKAEHGQIDFLLNSLSETIYDTERGTLEKMRLLPHVIDLNQEHVPVTVARRGKNLLENIFQKLSYEEGMGKIDANNLDIPEELGTMRDTVKASIAARESHIKGTQTLADFLDEFSAGALNVATALNMKVQQKDISSPSIDADSKETQESFQDFGSGIVGPNAAQLWAITMKISEDEAEKISDLGNALRKLTAEKLDSFLSGAEVGLKYETDTDDNNWKRLCDIARLQVNAKTRYLQSKAIQDKAQERVESAANRARLRTSSSDEIVNDSGHQNRVSLLRGGGEAMKKFQESAQMVIFKNMETEADTKAAKDKEVFDEASAAKDKAVAEYKRVTEARISKFEAENKQATDDFNEICEVMKSGIVKINNARFKSMEKCPLDKETVTFEWLVNDIQKWVQSTKKSVEESHDKALASESGNSQDPASLESQDGFKLGLALISSKSVDKLLELQGTEKSVPDLLIEPEESLEDATHSEQLNSNEDTKQNESHFEAKNEEKSTNKVEPATSLRSLRKSFTAPENSHAWVKAQGSFESAESNPDDADVQVKPVSEPPEIVTFRETFWSKTQNGEEPPEVLRVINCVFRPREMGGFLLSNLHGRLYTTKESIYFLAWEGRNFVMAFKKIVDIQKDKGLGFIAANDTLVVTYLSSEGNKAAFILSRLEAIDSTFEHLRNLLEAAEVQMEAEEIIKNPEDMALPPPVPPDKILKKMEIVLSKTIKNISVERVYEQCWSEGNGTSAPRFYGPWLESEGCFDFLVKHWETAEPGSEGFINEWCKDTYSQRRLVTFKFKRTSHLYIGPPVAFVKQMHYCRVEGKDKCILHMSASFEGIPYSDAFVVEMRWVGSRVGLNDLKIEVGLFVVFKKPTILKNQIKAGTINETKNVHKRLFDAVKRTCVTPGEEPEEGEAAEEDEVELTKDEKSGFLGKLWSMFLQLSFDKKILCACGVLALPVVLKFLSFTFGSRQAVDVAHLNNRIYELQNEIRSLQNSVDVIIALLKEHNAEEHIAE